MKQIIRTVRFEIETICKSEKSTGEFIQAAQNMVDEIAFAPRDQIDAEVKIIVVPEILETL